MELTFTIILLGSIAAMLLGIAKTGVPGLGMFGSLLMISTFKGYEMFASGAVVPLLIICDVTACWIYGRDRQRGILRKIFPPLLVGLVLGMGVICVMENSQFKLTVGVLAVSILLFEFVRKRLGWTAISKTRLFGWFCGIMAGLTTMLGNAAGPVISAFFASQDLDKQKYMGTTSVFTLYMNITKIPLLICATAIKTHMGFDAAQAQIITPTTFWLTLVFLPGLALGAFIGRRLFLLIPEKAFIPMVLILNFVAALHILVTAL
ncbi:MAG: sulfite exporter TauE/SafE family protein [Thermoguttaceae bacterium]|nr:sulfite exporter TauE/SafE family protein [Thermoguttaceae bacterium]MBQ6617037.1 sulfite exporter TauE/SafE family protein [Thermoguttaceae bacterium]